MTNEQLADIERRLNSATPGPWIDTDSKPEAEGVVLILAGSDPLSTDAKEICVFCDMEECEGQDLHNAAFVAHAPADIAALIAEVRRLQEESEAVRDALIDMVGQHCHLRPGQIHDSGLSSDEHACGVLERIGVIRAVDESQHRYEWVEVAADGPINGNTQYSR